MRLRQTVGLQEPAVITVLLLTISNVFMTIAWYGHLNHKNGSLWLVVLAS